MQAERLKRSHSTVTIKNEKVSWRWTNRVWWFSIWAPSYQGLLGCSACIFIRGEQEMKKKKKFCERPSWLPKTYLWWPQFLLLSLSVWDSIQCTVCSSTPHRLRQNIMPYLNIKSKIVKCEIQILYKINFFFWERINSCGFRLENSPSDRLQCRSGLLTFTSHIFTH